MLAPNGSAAAAQLVVLDGLALAMSGRRPEAEAAAREGTTLLPVSKDADQGTYVQLQAARIYLLVGQPERALDALEPLLRMPFYLSPGWLRIDPTFAPLRGTPRFERLASDGRAL